MGDNSEVFVGLDVAKSKNAVAIAEGGHRRGRSHGRATPANRFVADRKIDARCKTGKAPDEHTVMRYPIRASELDHRRLQASPPPMHVHRNPLSAVLGRKSIRRGGLHDHTAPHLIEAGRVGELHVVDPGIDAVDHQAEGLARYIDTVRPPSSCPEVFLCMHAPRRPLKAGSIYDVANRRFAALGIEAAHRGGHALRHACATRLLAEGLSHKEIGDHLGHRSTSATSTYAKVNTGALREVAAFDLGDVR
jgi:hypothetical protein